MPVHVWRGPTFAVAPIEETSFNERLQQGYALVDVYYVQLIDLLYYMSHHHVGRAWA